MPITQSAKKALRQSLKRKKRNSQKKEKSRDLIKQVRAFVLEKKAGEAEKLLAETYKSLDKLAKTNVIKKNTADRKKSRLARLINSAKKQG